MDAEGRGKENGEPPKVPVLTVALLFSSQLRSLRVPPEHPPACPRLPPPCPDPRPWHSVEPGGISQPGASGSLSGLFIHVIYLFRRFIPKQTGVCPITDGRRRTEIPPRPKMKTRRRITANNSIKTNNNGLLFCDLGRKDSLKAA